MYDKFIRILFYTGDDFISRVIKYVTRSEMTHVSIQVDKWHIAEARLGKPLSITHIKDYKHVVKMIDVPLTECDYDLVVKTILNELDKEYDVEDILSFLLPSIKGTEHKRICSEFVVEVLNAVGFELDKDKYSPSDLYNELKGRCGYCHFLNVMTEKIQS